MKDNTLWAIGIVAYLTYMSLPLLLSNSKEILKVYSTNDIYYVDYSGLNIMSEKGVVLKFNSLEDLKESLSDLTSQDAVKSNKDLADCVKDKE